MSLKSLAVSIAAALFAVSPAMAQSPSTIEGLAAKAADKGLVRVIVRFGEPATASALSSEMSGKADLDHVTQLRATQGAIIGKALGDAVAASAGGGDRHAITLMDVEPMFAATVDASELKRLSADPRIVSVQEDRLDAPSLIQSTGIIRMTGTTGAWAKNATGTGRVVAVLDTGVNKNHEFLKYNATVSKVVSEACFNTKEATLGATSRCPGGAIASTRVNSGLDCGPTITGCGHGTHVAGIAAGKNTSQTAGEPSKGVAFNAGILAINVFSRFSRTNSGSPCFGASQDCVLSFTSDQIKALERVFALRGGIGPRKIASVNMSLGGGFSSGFCDTDSRKPIIDKLRAAGIATVIASGNESFTGGVAAPGCISSAITVGASSKRAAGNAEKVASYSNMGSPVDVFAPGGDFGYPASLGNASLIKSSHFNTYDFLAGTSMAAPHVAGVFAAIKSRPACANKTVNQIESAMKTTGLLIRDTRSGGTLARRRVDVAAVIAKLCP